MKPLDKMSDEEYENHVVQRFRETHHQMALMVAAGWTPAKISRVTGRSQRSIGLTLNNPMFQELVAQKRRAMASYEDQWLREQLEEHYNQERREWRRATLLDNMLYERLEAAAESGEYPSYRDMNLLLSESLSRLGFGKHSTVHHDIDFAGALERGIKRSGVLQPKMIEAEIVDIQPRIEARAGAALAQESRPAGRPSPAPTFKLRRL